MNTRLVNSAAGVINAALTQNRTAAGIALALESAQLLMTPEKAVELAELRRQVESSRVDGRRLIRAEQRSAELEAVLGTHRDADRAEIERLRARVAELEAGRAAVLDDFIARCEVALSGCCSECDAAAAIVKGRKQAALDSAPVPEWSADKLTALFAPTQVLREDEPEAPALTVFRASHDSIVFGLYTTREAAREHCQTLMERASVATLEWRPDGEWREDDDGEPGPDEAEELYEYGTHESATWDPTGYVVTPLEVASKYDEEADE